MVSLVVATFFYVTYTRSSKGANFKEGILIPPLFTFSDGTTVVDNDDNDVDERAVATDSEPVETDVFNSRALFSRLISSFSFRSFS